MSISKLWQLLKLALQALSIFKKPEPPKQEPTAQQDEVPYKTEPSGADKITERADDLK